MHEFEYIAPHTHALAQERQELGSHVYVPRELSQRERVFERGERPLTEIVRSKERNIVPIVPAKLFDIKDGPALVQVAEVEFRGHFLETHNLAL